MVKKKTNINSERLKNSFDKTPRQKLPPLRMNPMSQEQGMIKSFFGGGDRVIFGNEESESKVNISGALMPNQFDDEDDSTAQSFGFGSIKSRSGLF
jgi:hypothetical protein